MWIYVKQTGVYNFNKYATSYLSTSVTQDYDGYA